MNRRDALKATLAAASFVGAPIAAAKTSQQTRQAPFRLIYEGEWNDIPCVDYPLTPEKWVAETIRPLAGTQVDTLFYNLASSDGFVCELKSAQILMDNFDKLEDAWVWRYRENTKLLIRAGANPPDLAVKHGHALGMKVIPVVRMNDLHDALFRFEVSAFKQANPQFLIGHKTGYVDFERGLGGHPHPLSIDSFTWGMFDYAHEEVRAHKHAIIEEFITRWDNDGVSLDFHRHPRFFVEEGDAKNAETMTALIRQVRGILDKEAEKRGRPLYLHVKVLPKISSCFERGLDVETWVQEGLVDAITPGAGYMTFTLDLAPWKTLVKGHDCWVYPASNHWKTPEVSRAWAKLMYERGADGLYLFNFGHLLYGFDKNSSPKAERLGTVWYDELHPCYYEVLNQIGKLETLTCQNATYDMEAIPHEEGRFYFGANERRFDATDAIELPIVLSLGRHSLKLPFAEDIAGAQLRGCSASIMLRMKIANFTFPDHYDVSLNGTQLDNRTRTARAAFIMNNDSWVIYPVSSDLLKNGINEMVIDVQSLNTQMSSVPKLQNVELVVKYN